MRKRSGWCLFVIFLLALFFSPPAFCETIYFQDFSSPGTLQDLGFLDVTNWTRDEVNDHTVAGVGGDPFMTLSYIYKPLTAARDASEPLSVEWQMNLQNSDPLASGQLRHTATVKSEDSGGMVFYSVEFESQEDADGPYIDLKVSEQSAGALGNTRLDAMPGFTWVTVRLEFHPDSAGGDAYNSILLDYGDRNGFTEVLRVTDASVSQILEYPRTGLIFLYHMTPSTAVYFDDLKITTGDEVTPANGTATYQYDALGRLRNVSFDDGINGSDVEYMYDDTGNRTQRIIIKQ